MNDPLAFAICIGLLALAAGPGRSCSAEGFELESDELDLEEIVFECVDRAPKPALKAMATFAKGRKGYVVWESRRPSGTENYKYRIWKRNLDGTGLAMISGEPEVPLYAHLGPRISPDGRQVIFAGKDWNSYNDPQTRTVFNGCYVVPPLDVWIVDIDPKTLEPGKPREFRELRNRIGTAFEDHFFEWKNNRIVYVNLPNQRGIYEFDVTTGKIGRQALNGVPRQAILSPGGKHAISGGQIARIKPSADGPATPEQFKTLRPQGCQGRVSCLDNWVVWMHHGQGGKIRVLSRQNLQTGESSVVGGILDTLPRGHDYLYFPAFSRDMTILAVGGSDMHSHAFGDYEIFLFRLNPRTFEVTSKPVRYSFNERSMYKNVPANSGHVLDRWPDVWVSNPKFNGHPVVAATTSKDGKSGKLSGLSSKLLRREVDRLMRAKTFTAIFRTLEQLAADEQQPDKAAEAKRITAHLESWAADSLERARALEEPAPGEAINIYKDIKQKFRGRKNGTAAAERIAQLNNDEKFSREVAAWELLQSMLRLEKGLKIPKKGKPTCENRIFAKTNESRIKRIQDFFVHLQKDYPATRAMLEARSLVQRYAIKVPIPPPISTVVQVVVEATVTRTSEPPKLKDVAPYTEAFICTQYKVERVLTGELRAKRLVTMQLAMQEGELLPPARFRAGQAYILRIGPWSVQTHYHAHPASDDIEDLDADLYFIFSAEPVK